MPSTPPRGLRENVPLSGVTTLGTGGLARYWFDVEDEPSLVAALRWAADTGLPVQILGGGSNVVCADEGFPGCVLRIGLSGVELREHGGRCEVTAGAGEVWDPFVAWTVERELAGLECLSGIPGRVGATPIQNVGAYGQDVSQTLSRVRCLDRETLEFVEFAREACQLSYRDSRFKRQDEGRYVVTRVSFELTPRGKPQLDYGDLKSRVKSEPTLSEVRSAVLAARREKSMLADPSDVDGRSCGSFFLNPILSRDAFERVCSRSDAEVPHYLEADGRVKVPAAFLIEASGVRKGQRLGRAGVSSKHALCLVAHPGASSHEVRELAVLVKRSVAERFGITLDPEPRFIGLAPP